NPAPRRRGLAAGLHRGGAGWARDCSGRRAGGVGFLAVTLHGANGVSPLSITRGECEGFETVEVDTGVLGLSLMPDLGGKINSLRDLRTGREWLWRNPRI